MKELKFKAWDKWKKKMIQPKGGDFIAWHAMSNWRECLEVLQYTGLKDSRGIDICEGDIIAVNRNGFTPENMVVTFFMGNACYSFLGHTETGTPIYPNLINHNKVVIGNIYENPELLKEV